MLRSLLISLKINFPPLNELFGIAALRKLCLYSVKCVCLFTRKIIECQTMMLASAGGTPDELSEYKMYGSRWTSGGDDKLQE